MAISSPDKMHSFNGVFRPVGVYVFTLCLACSKEHLCSVLMLCVCRHIGILDECTLYVSFPLARVIFQF